MGAFFKVMGATFHIVGRSVHRPPAVSRLPLTYSAITVLRPRYTDSNHDLFALKSRCTTATLDPPPRHRPEFS